MIEIRIPGRGTCSLGHLVLDVNGTITLGGELIPGVSQRLSKLQQSVDVHLLTAPPVNDFIDAARIEPEDAAAQKAEFVRRLGSERVCAVGNGAIDAQMLEEAALAIAVLGEEGLALSALTSADVVVPNVCAALDLLLDPLRVVATLRR